MKYRLFLMVMLAALLPWTAFGQDPQPSPTQTLYDGVATNSAVPIQGLYCDEGVKCEFVIPSTQLGWLEDATITALRFYLSESSELQANFTVFVKEVGTTALTAYTGLTDATTVYSGPISFNAEDELEIPFSSSYAYNGGNLLIGFYQNGTCNWSRTRFCGTAQTYASAWQGYGNSAGSGVMFLPAVTLEYIPPQGTLAEMITVGDNETTHWALPINTGYSENLSQQIYTTSELGSAGIIESIDFFYYDDGDAQTRHVDVYMVGTDKEYFNDYSDWIPVSAENLVYSGNITFEPGVWNSIELDNPFNYNGSQNVAILMYNHESGQISAPDPLFRTFYTTQRQALYVSSGWNTFDPFDPPQASDNSDNLKNQIRVTKGNPSCTRPLNLAVNYTGGTTAVVSWTSEANTFELMVNGTVTNVNGNSYTLNNLELGAVYELKIRANCGADGHSTWSNPIHFTTDFCLPEDRCGIIFELFYSEEGWNGNAIQVADAASNTILATVTMGYEDSHIETIPVCDGQELSFTWVGDQNFDGAYTVYDANHTELFSGNGSAGLPSSYTVNCPDCWIPMNVEVDYSGGTTAVVSWLSNASSVEIMLNGMVIPNVSTNPYTLSNLIPNTANEVKIRANCGVDGYSNWSNPVVFYTSEDQCELIMNLLCSSGNGWHGNAILLVDATTHVVIDSLTFESGEAVYRNPTVCDGQVISFEWVNGEYPADTYYYLYDAYYNPITSGWAGFNLPENYTVHCDPLPCPVPYYLNYSYTNDSTVAISWSSDATDFDIQINGTVYHNVTNPYSLSVTPGTVYEVQVRAACGEGEYSYWSEPLTFSTECLPENQCEIYYNLHSTNVYGWNAEILLVDVATGDDFDRLTLQGITESSGSIFVCDGQEISFLWQSEDYGNNAMASYEFYDADNTLIFSGSAGNGLLYSYTVNCPVCKVPFDLAVDYTGGTTAEVSWVCESDATSFDLMINGTEYSGVTNPYTLSNLVSGNVYEVQVRANCGADGYSGWSDPYIFSACPPDDQCVIYYRLSGPDNGWNGNAIQVVDATTHIVLDTWTTSDSNDYGSMDVCDGQVIGFEWIEGTFPADAYYEVYDAYEEMIFSGFAGYNLPETYTVHCDETPCPIPYLLDYYFTDNTTVEITWASNATTFDIRINGTIYQNVTNPYTLSNLVPGTVYEAQVRTVCEEGEGEYSYWSVPLRFRAACSTEDQCVINYHLLSTSEDGWNGAIYVVDDATGDEVNHVGLDQSESFGSISVCDGQVISFFWRGNHDYDDVASYEFFDLNNELIFSGSAGNGLVTSYTVNCTQVACPTPLGVTVDYTGGSTAEVSWVSNDVSYDLMINDLVYTNVISPYTLSDLASNTTYEVQLRANCGEGEYSNWSHPVLFTTGCSPEDQCEISYELTDSWGDGWNGNAIQVKDVSSNEIIAILTIESGSSASGTISACDGHALSFLWISGSFVNETSYAFYDHDNEMIFNGSAGYGLLNSYIVQCDFVSCESPENLDVANLTMNSASVTWDEEQDISYNLRYRESATPQGDIQWTVVDNVSSPYILNGLSENNCYEVQVQAICDVDDESEWSSSLSFITPESCPTPTLSFSDLTSSSVVLNWTSSPDQTSWQICFNGNENNPQTVSDNPYTLLELTELTSYTVKVRANCDSEGYSNWSNEVNFTTLQTAASLPYSTSFEDACDWVLVNGNNTNAWTWGDATSNSGKKALYISNDGGESNTYNTNGNPSRVYAAKTFTFDADFYNLFFDWRAYGDDYYDYLGVFLTTEDKLLIPDYDEDPSNDDDVMRLVDNQELKGVTDWQTKNIEVSITEAGRYKLVFMWVNNGYEGSQHPAALDNVSIKRVTCNTPENLVCSDLTASSATLSWSVPETQTTWDICLNNDEDNLITATSNPFTLTGLSELTAYTVKIRANCGSEDGYSNWTNPISFKTIQTPADLPYHTMFEDTCDWVLVNGSFTNAWCWGTGTNNTEGGEKALYISNDGGSSWCYQGNKTSTVYATKAFNFEAGVYSISFDWAAYGESDCDYVRAVLVPASVTLNASYNLPAGLNTSNVPQGWIAADGGSGLSGRDYWSTSSSTITVPTAGAYMLVFVWRNDYSGGYQHPGAIDNVSINLVPGHTLDIAGYGDNDNGWNLIASPLAESVAATAVSNLVAETVSDFDLYRFNQAANMEWENWKQEGDHYHFNLEVGRGYLYASKEDVTLIFAGELYNGNGEVTLSMTTGSKLEGWNLVGNPFTDTAYIDRPFYVMNSYGSEIIAAADAEQNSIAPMEGVFVIAEEDGETLTFTTQAPQAPQEGGVVLNLSQGRGVIDRAIVRFGEGRQLPKFQLKENSTKVYIPKDNRDYAVVSAESEGEMPVSFKAKENSTYTLNFSSEEVGFNYLHLIDNLTGNDVDLLQTPSYSFEANTMDYASRFKLVFAISNAEGENNFAFFSNGNIVVNGEGTLQVIDMLGRIIATRRDGACTISTDAMMAGVYVLRLINGDNVKTQKIIIR